MKILILLALSISNVYPKKLGHEEIMLIENPASAATIAVGYVKENFWGKQTFHSIKGWTNFPREIELQQEFTGLGLEKPAKENEWYIFYSNKSTTEKGEIADQRLEGLLLLDSEEGKALIKKLSEKKDFSGDVNPSWQFCESADECISHYGVCIGVISLNKSYVKYFEEISKVKKGDSQCKEEKNRVFIPKSTDCINRFCTI